MPGGDVSRKWNRRKPVFCPVIVAFLAAKIILATNKNQHGQQEYETQAIPVKEAVFLSLDGSHGRGAVKYMPQALLTNRIIFAP